MSSPDPARQLRIEDDETASRCVLYCPGRETCARSISPLPRSPLDESPAYDFVLCSNGHRAWDLLRRAEFDALIIEEDLEGLGGLDFLALVHGAQMKLPIVFISHTASGEVAETAVNLGAAALLFYRDEDALAPLLNKQLARVLAQRDLEERNRELVGALRDSNARLEREVEARTSDLTEALESLRSLDRIKGELITLVGHELRTPLSSILGYAELLEMSESLERTERERIAKGILGAGERLARFAEDCLELSQWYSDQHPFNMGPCQIDEVVVAAVDRIRPVARERGVRVELEALQPAGVRGDGEVLTDAVTRVLDNATKFSDPNQVVTVRANATDQYVIEIVDRGVGIHPDRLESLFTPVEPCDPADQRRRGPGLGLALVRLAVEAHGGQMELESAGTNRGTVVRLRLPVRPPSNAVRRAGGMTEAASY